MRKYIFFVCIVLSGLIFMDSTAHAAVTDSTKRYLVDFGKEQSGSYYSSQGKGYFEYLSFFDNYKNHKVTYTDRVIGSNSSGQYSGRRYAIFKLKPGAVFESFTFYGSVFNEVIEMPEVPPITDLIGAAGDKEVTLSWKAPVNGKRYAIYENGVHRYTATNNTHTIKNLRNDVKYKFGVANFPSDFEGYSEIVSIELTPTTPRPPTNIKITSGIKELKISFDPVPNAVGYYLHYNGQKILLYGNQYTLKNLDPDIPVSITLSTVYAGDEESTQSLPVIGIPYGENVPPILSAKAEYNRIRIEWVISEGDTAAAVFVNGVSVGIISPDQRQIDYNEVSIGQKYSIYMHVRDKYGRLQKSETVEVTIPEKPADFDPPSKPQGFKATMSSDYKAVELTWNPNKESDLDGYNLYVLSDDNYRKLNDKRLTNTSYSWKDIKTEQKYDFKLEALDTSGNVSEPSLTTILVPSRETESEQKPQDDYLLVTWTETAGASGYNIYLNGRKVGSVGPDVFEFKITKAMGYIPGALSNKAEVKAVFEDGSEGGSSPSGPGSGNWGDGADFLDVREVLKAAVSFLALYSHWIILALAVIFSPVLYKLALWLVQYLSKKHTQRS